jgi:hypothetical protein
VPRDARPPAPEPVAFAGEAVTLFASRLGTGAGGGSRYDALVRAPFRA